MSDSLEITSSSNFVRCHVVYPSIGGPLLRPLWIVAFDNALLLQPSCVFDPLKLRLVICTELVGTCRLDDLAVARRVNIFSNGIKNQFTHQLSKLVVLSPVSRHEYVVANWFLQRANVMYISIQNFHVSVS